MSNLDNIPKQSLFKTTLKEPIDSSQTTGIIMADLLSYTPGGETLYLTLLDPNNQEVISFTGQNSTGELTGVTRGLALATGGASSAAAHGSGIQCVLSNPFNLYEDIQTAINSKFDITGSTITGLLDFSGSGRIQVPVFADATARDAAIPSPVNGLIVYNTADGELQVYQGGAWSNISSGSTQPNATETVAGKVELATQSEANAGTAIGGTGASLTVTPDKLAKVLQNNPHVSAVTGGASNAYTATFTPAVTAYVAGQIFHIQPNHTNTGAATLDVNTLGAVAIHKYGGGALEGGELQSGEQYMVIYEGSEFHLINPNIAPNKGDIVVGKGSGVVTALAAGSDGQLLVYDSSAAAGITAKTYRLPGDQGQGSTTALINANDLTQFQNVTGGTTTLTRWQPYAKMVMTTGGGATEDMGLTDITDSVITPSTRIIEGRVRFTENSGANFNASFGYVDGNAAFDNRAGTFGDDLVLLKYDTISAGKSGYYFYSADGTNDEDTDVATMTSGNDYLVRIEIDTECRLYIDNLLVATHSTAVPSIGNLAQFGLYQYNSDNSNSTLEVDMITVTNIE